MDISPQRVRTIEFKTVKRGLDPDEVRSFLNEVASELERAQNQSTAMEARARAAVARLQELSEGSAITAAAAAESSAAESSAAESDDAVSDGTKSDSDQPVAALSPDAASQSGDASVSDSGSRDSMSSDGSPSSTVNASVDESETISRTLLLAQRTADMTIAEARAEAERIASEASGEASRTIDSTREMSAKMLDDARAEARLVGQRERDDVEAEVSSLNARRDFLESDVDHLEQHLADERTRLREAANSLLELTERVPGGLGEVRRPIVSASDDDATGSDAGASSGTDSESDAPGTDGPTQTSMLHDTSDDDTGEIVAPDSDGGGSDSDSEDEFSALDDSDDDGGVAEVDVDDTGGLLIETDISDDVDPTFDQR